MILEVAVLNIRAGESDGFEKAFSEAEMIISSATGYQWHQLQRCIENPSQYLLLVQWNTLEDHIDGFRQSREYLKWKELLHHFYDPFPKVEHYKMISSEESRNQG
jgi:heme-degrading monooxygenase HmoA